MFYVLLIIAAALAVVVFELVRSLGIYRKFRGDRILSCNGNHQPAAVRVAAGKAAIEATVGAPHLELRRMLALAGNGQPWPGVFVADSRGAEGLPGLQYCQSMV